MWILNGRLCLLLATIVTCAESDGCVEIWASGFRNSISVDLLSDIWGIAVDGHAQDANTNASDIFVSMPTTSTLIKILHHDVAQATSTPVKIVAVSERTSNCYCKNPYGLLVTSHRNKSYLVAACQGNKDENAVVVVINADNTTVCNKRIDLGVSTKDLEPRSVIRGRDNQLFVSFGRGQLLISVDDIFAAGGVGGAGGARGSEVGGTGNSTPTNVNLSGCKDLATQDAQQLAYHDR
jgi:hypothetical protein